MPRKATPKSEVEKILTAQVEAAIAPPAPVPTNEKEAVQTEKPKRVRANKIIVTAQPKKVPVQKAPVRDFSEDDDEASGGDSEQVEPKDVHGDTDGVQGVEGTQVPSPPKHSAAVLALAKDFGLSDDQINSYEPGELGAYVHAQVRAAREYANRGAPQTASGPAPAPEPEPIFRQGFDETQFDPALIEELKNEKAEKLALKKRLEAIEKQIADNAKTTQERQQIEWNNLVDGVFKELANPAFGAGTYTSVSPLERAKRNAVINSLVEVPMPGIQVTEAIKRRAKELFPGPVTRTTPVEGTVAEDDTDLETVAAAPVDKLAQKKKEWVDGAVAAPTQRQGAREPGTPANVKNAFIKTATARGQMGHQPAPEDENFI